MKKINPRERLLHKTEEDGEIQRVETGYAGFSKALSMLNPLAPSTHTPNALVHIMSREEKKVLERYRIRLAEKRYRAIELARRVTYL